jgi:hypothetical protein
MDWDYLSNATIENDWESNWGDYLNDEGMFDD